MTRVKTPAINPPTDLHTAEKVMEQYAKDDGRMEEINAVMDQRIAVIRGEYAAEQQVLNERISLHKKQLQMFAESNRNDLFTGKKKSFSLSQGIIGYRTGTPKCSPAKGYTWAIILKLLGKTAPEYIRTKEEPDKDLLIANREKPEVKSVLLECGMEIKQDETFFIELKKEGVDASLN